MQRRNQEGQNFCFFLYTECAKLLHSSPTLRLQILFQQALLSTGFSRQEHESGLLFPPPVDRLNPGIKPSFLMSLRSYKLAFYNSNYIQKGHCCLLLNCENYTCGGRNLILFLHWKCKLTFFSDATMDIELE